MFEPVEHAVNGDGQLAVFLPPLEGVPVAWRPDGQTGIWIEIPDALDKGIGVSPASGQAAASSGRILVVEVELATRSMLRQTWLDRSED